MSLETAIQENTEALHALIATLKAQAALGTSAAPTVASQPTEDAPKATRGKARAANPAPAPAAPTAPTPPTATEAAADAPVPKAAPSKASATPAEAPADAPAVDYDSAARAITNLAKAQGRDAAVAVLARFGASRLPDVAAEHFAAVIDACEQALAAATEEA